MAVTALKPTPMPLILGGMTVGIFAILAIAIVALEPATIADLESTAITTETAGTDADAGRNEVEAGGFPNIDSSTEHTMPVAE